MVHNKSTGRPESSHRLYVCIILLIAIGTGVFMFLNPDGVKSADEYRNADWLSILQFRTHLNKSFAEQGRLPLWNPYLGGGYPTIFHHSDGTLSPFSLPILAFGDVYGVKINLILLLFLGGLGVYLIGATQLGFGRTGALFAACSYMLSGWFGSMMLVGFYNLAFFHLVPLTLFCLIRACENLKWATPGALFFAVFSYVAGSGFFTAGIFLAILSLLFSFRSLRPFKFDLRPLVAFAAILVLAVGIGAVKFIGVKHLLSKGTYAHGQAQAKGHYENAFRPDAFYSNTGEFVRGLLWHVPKKAEYKDGRPLTLEYAWLGVPWAAVALFWLSSIILWKRQWPLVLTCLLFLILCFGPRSPVDLYRLIIWPFEPLKSISQFYKYANYFIMFVVTLVAGGAINLLSRYKKTGKILTGLIFVSLAPFFFVNGSLFTEIFKLDAPAAEPFGEFHQVNSAFNPAPWHGEYAYREMVRPVNLIGYYNLKRNVGTIDWYADIYLPEFALPKYLINPKTGVKKPYEGYKGEAHFTESENKVIGIDIGYGAIEVMVDVQKPDTLVINQNYHQGWESKQGEVFPRHGLIGVQLEKAGRYQVNLEYSPKVFRIGLVISLFSLILACAFWFADGRKKKGALG